MKKATFVLLGLAVIGFATTASAGFLHNAGSFDCPASECQTTDQQNAWLKHAIMQSKNCSGHGHTFNPSKPLCFLGDGDRINATLSVAGENPQLWEYVATKVTQVPATYLLNLKSAPPGTTVGFRFINCIQTVEVQEKAFASLNVALEWAWGVSFKVVGSGGPPSQTHCLGIIITENSH